MKNVISKQLIEERIRALEKEADGPHELEFGKQAFANAERRINATNSIRLLTLIHNSLWPEPKDI